jgi:hypothetical protein
MSHLQKNVSQNWCIISVLVLFCSLSLLFETILIVMKFHDLTDKEIQNILIPAQ